MAYLMLGRYKATPPTVADGEYIELLVDENGRLQVDIAAAIPAGTAEIGKVRITDGTEDLAVNADNSINADVTVVAELPAGTQTLGQITTNLQPNDQWPPISGDGRSLLFGAITQGAAGTTALVAADADELYYVVSYVVVLDAAGSFKFTDGTADLTGVIPTDANGGVAAIGSANAPLFKTQAVNRALNIVTVTGKAFGHFSYYKASS